MKIASNLIVISSGCFLWLLCAGSVCGNEEGEAEVAKAGQAVVSEVFGRLSAALSSAVAKEGAKGALAVCSEKAPQVMGEVAQTHGVTLRRATMKPRNPQNAAGEEERKMLEEFMRAVAGGEAPRPKLVKNADGTMDFYAPIVLGNALCLQCHGSPDAEVSADTLAEIRRLYPEDKATGFKMGDLRGLWRVTFSAEEKR